MKRLTLLLAATVASVLAADCLAADWPQYRHDSGRSAASVESLPKTMHLAWVRELPTPQPAFPTELRLRYDATYEPIVLGKTMFVASMVTDSVAALSTETGAECWRFFTEGPVRLAPVAWRDKVYFVSDDGYLYCVAAGDGKLLWKFRGLPDGRKDRTVMGNQRLISLFPARGGPVLDDGIVYFGAGIWSGEGVFVHAVDANTGQAIWSNVDSDRIEKANMDHGVAYFAGISPQGHMAIVGDKLVVPCGAHLPAFFDLKTGKIAPYTMGWGGRVGLPKGCTFVSGSGKYLLHGGDLYDIGRQNQEQPPSKSMLYPGGLTRLQIERNNQKPLGEFREPVITQDVMYCQQDGIMACSLTDPKIEERAKAEIPAYRKNDFSPDILRATFPNLWRLASKSKVHIKSGDKLYCGRPGLVEAVDIPKQGAEPGVSWEAKIQGTPHRMLAADGKLFVVTREGSIYAFGQDKPADPTTYAKPSAPAAEADQWTERVARLLEMSELSDGYVVILGVGSGRLAEEIVRQSRCDVIAVDSDAEKVAALRTQFHQAGLYGSRIAICVGDPSSYTMPPYVASLIVSEDEAALANVVDGDFVKGLYRSLRPFGGTACLAIPVAAQQAFLQRAAAELPGSKVRQTDRLVMLTRSGPLADTANWSHAAANAANTGASQDRFVKAPLTRLWFDGSFRWIRTPGATHVRIAGGRVFVKSLKLNAIDVFTGRHLWETALPPDHGRPDDVVAVEDALYLPCGRSLAVIDPATGKQSGSLDLPDEVEGRWAKLRVAEDRIISGFGKQLVCINRQNGKLLWSVDCERVIGGIALGGGKVFCADFVNIRRGEPKPDVTGLTVQAFDLATGDQFWQVAGANEVRYNEPHDLVVTSSGVYKAQDGSRIWNSGQAWPITEDRLLSGNSARFSSQDLLTGEKSTEEIAWNKRGCTLLRASSNMLTTRYMGNAAYVDLESGKITSIWNVRAACSNNLFPANGVLNIPNLSGGCTCNYMPISQAFVPTSVFE